jgi:tetratricopeptide (TPR) repeat protein
MQNKMKKSTLLIFSLLFALVSMASENQLIIAKANKAYSDELYTNAADLYKKVIASGYESWELFYNLGNTYYKLNDYPSAILYYERAKKLNPGNDDIDFNLKVTNNKISDKIEPLPELFYKRWYRNLVESFPVDFWSLIIVITFVLSIFSASLFIISRRLFIRKAGFWMGILFFILSLCSFLFAWQNFQTVKNNTAAIIFAPTVTIKSSPDEKSVDLFVLHEGTKVQILDNIGVWYEISISNGSVGWLPSSAVERI